jgi:PAS domain S-box-containing protein
MGSAGFLPHGHCYLWTPWLLRLYCAADGLIALAYFSIPFVLLYLVRKRQDIEFKWLLILFSSFILACGSTHAMAVWTIWHPDYWLDAGLRAVTAFLSVLTAITLWPMLPKALALPSPAQLQLVIARLEREVADRRMAEAKLEEANWTQELHVNARTEELTIMNSRLKAEVALRKKAEERFRKVIEFTPNAMLMVNTAGIIEMANAQAETLFARPRAQLLGTSIEALVPSSHRAGHPQLRANYFSAPSSRPMGAGRDLYAVRGDGSEFPVEIGLNPIETDEGPKVLSAILDISDRKQREQSLSAALDERNVLLREIHHRVKNNLQVIESLLAISFDEVDDPHIRMVVNDSRDRVRTMAVIHQTLYESENFAKVGFGTVLGNLVPTLVNSYVTTPDSVQVSINAENIELPISNAVPCALLVNELISNALKHAYSKGEAGRIEVELGMEAASQLIVLKVQDHGKGLPESFDIDKAETVGLQLVKLLTSQIGGELSVNARNPTAFRIAFPVRRN